MSTGHSLGGALAQLAAHDIAVAAVEQGMDIRIGCYTYGSPRVGNHAFAREFDKVVPHCWHVINDQVRALRFQLTSHVQGSINNAANCDRTEKFLNPQLLVESRQVAGLMSSDL